MSVKDFKRIGNLLVSPFRLTKSELIDFLCDVKERTKGVIEYTMEDLMKLDKDDLIVEYDCLRNKVHHSAKLFFLLFPTLEKEWLDKLSQQKLSRKERVEYEIERLIAKRNGEVS